MALDIGSNIIDRLSKTLIGITAVGGLIAFPISIMEWDGASVAIWAVFSLTPTLVYLFLVWLLTGKLIQKAKGRL